MTKQQDLRVRKTKEALYNAFFKLLAQQSFEQITIQSLTTTALVGKATFYNHYVDKYALAQEIIDTRLAHYQIIFHERISQMQSAMTSEADVAQSIPDAAKIMDEFHLLLKVKTPEIDFESHIKAFITQEYEQLLAATTDMSLMQPHGVSQLLAAITLEYFSEARFATNKANASDLNVQLTELDRAIRRLYLPTQPIH